jgi:hypothetical protein
MPTTCAIAVRGFIDILILDTIHSNKLLYIAFARASLPEPACAGFNGTS